MALLDRIRTEVGDEVLGPPGVLPEQRPLVRGQGIA
jgi:hypothetical protein